MRSRVRRALAAIAAAALCVLLAPGLERRVFKGAPEASWGCADLRAMTLTPLSHGGSKDVFAGSFRGRDVVVKSLRTFTGNALRSGFRDERRQFRVEARALAKDSPHIIKFYGLCDGFLRPAVAVERCFADLRTFVVADSKSAVDANATHRLPDLSYGERLELTIQVAEALLAGERALGAGRILCDHHYGQYMVCADDTSGLLPHPVLAPGGVRIKLSDLDSLRRRGAQAGRRCASEPADYCARGCDAQHGRTMAHEYTRYVERKMIPGEFKCVNDTCPAFDTRLNAFRACRVMARFLTSHYVPPTRALRSLRGLMRECSRQDPEERASLGHVVARLRALRPDAGRFH